MSKAAYTPIEVYKILPQTNCGRCQLPSCLAFAAAIAAGSRQLKECPDLDQGIAAEFSGRYQKAGKKKEEGQADIALILHPLPKVPLLICYQGPEGDLPSKLTIFFDASCSTNLHIKSIYTLCAGLVQMFAKIGEHHR